ncbi:MAG: DUF2141 domain-containing protein [Bacteroidota bacterium]
MRLLFLFFLLFSITQGFAQSEIHVEVLNVPASEGKINVALYNHADAFLEFDKVFASKSVPAQKGSTKLVLQDLPKGEYAIALFYDQNGNDELDTNWLGIPKEKVAFSKGKLKAFGPPKFEECAFRLKDDLSLQISL